MTRIEAALGKIPTLFATALSGWRVPTLRDVRALVVFVLKQGK
jgi:hypothetical protein